MNALRQAWLSIDTHEYEEHMSRVGQAQANASILQSWLTGLPKGSRLLIPGAGPGQILQFLPPDIWDRVDATFADLNPDYVAILQNRGVRARVDDIEHSLLEGPFDAAAIVLVLEHVDWQAALSQLPRWQCRDVLIVIQENPPQMASAITPGLRLPPSLECVRDTAHPHLIPQDVLLSAMSGIGFRHLRTAQRDVLHGKRMLGCWFTSVITQSQD